MLSTVRVSDVSERKTKTRKTKRYGGREYRNRYSKMVLNEKIKEEKSNKF